MNKKRDYDKERMMRRAEAKKKRVERVVSGYIFHKYPVIYAEALTFYDKLNGIYPGKSDLRKTHQYMAFVRECNASKTVGDNLVLKIPLIKQPAATTTTTTTTATTTIGGSATGTEQPTATTATTGTSTPSVVLPGSLQVVQPTDFQIDDATLMEIINDLKSDTTSAQFFDDIDLNFPELDIPDVSPLELELSG